jgi:UDP-glucose 4-epimerase
MGLRVQQGDRRVPGAGLLEGTQAAGDHRALLQHCWSSTDRHVRNGDSELRRQALAGHPITVFGDGTQSRSFTHVVDVVDALLKLVDEPKAIGQVVNIGNTEEVTIRALAERVRDLSHSSSPITYIPYDQAYESGFEDMPRRVPDLRKVSEMIGYRPRHGLDDILKEVIDYFRTR